MVCVHLSQTMLRAIVRIDVYVLDSLHQKKRATKTVQYLMQFNLLLLFSSEEDIYYQLIEKNHVVDIFYQ